MQASGDAGGRAEIGAQLGLGFGVEADGDCVLLNGNWWVNNPKL